MVKGPVTREMVMFRDIALINRGELCSKRYAYNNESIPPVTVSDSIHIRICDQAGDLIYYNYGETIFGIRRAIERCMHYGYSYYTPHEAVIQLRRIGNNLNQVARAVNMGEVYIPEIQTVLSEIVAVDRKLSKILSGGGLKWL